MRPTAVSGVDTVARRAEILAGVDALAAESAIEDLPELVGALARAQALAALRFGRGAPTSVAPSLALLTVEEVAAKLRISEPNVYARSKTDLRAAAVDVGPGQLRFDARAVERFIEARRRG